MNNDQAPSDPAYPKLDPEMPFQIIRVLDKGRCIVTGTSEIVKCPDCDQPIRYGGSWNMNVLEFFTDEQLGTIDLIKAEYGTKGSSHYYDILMDALVEAHPPTHQIPA